MKMSPAGRAKLIAREGAKLHAYKDTVGVWTIGVGHTSAAGEPHVTPGLTITKAECDAIFARDLVQYERAVDKAVKVSVTQGEFDAMVSLCFNIGIGGFSKSSVVRLLNRGDRAGAAAAFMMWDKPAEIIGRRRGEQKQFMAAAPKGEIEKSESEPEPQHQPDDPGVETAEPRKKTGVTEVGSTIGVGNAMDTVNSANEVITTVNQTKENVSELGVFDYATALLTNPRFLISAAILIAIVGGIVWWQFKKRRR